MKAILFALPILLLCAAAWATGYFFGKKSRLSRGERAQLAQMKKRETELFHLALDHLETEPFAVIVMDELRKKEIDK